MGSLKHSLTAHMDFKTLKTYQLLVILQNYRLYACKMKYLKELYQPNIMSAKSDKLKTLRKF
jgi:hypothetical protein